jgi:hypothetical protein
MLVKKAFGKRLLGRPRERIQDNERFAYHLNSLYPDTIRLANLNTLYTLRYINHGSEHLILLHGTTLDAARI